MPHCIVEHSESLNGDQLMASVFEGALASELFEADGSDIKVRSQSFACYRVGTGQSTFVHVVLKILSGRDSGQKVILSQRVLDKLTALGLSRCSITVEVVDIDRASYSKLET